MASAPKQRSQAGRAWLGFAQRSASLGRSRERSTRRDDARARSPRAEDVRAGWRAVVELGDEVDVELVAAVLLSDRAVPPRRVIGGVGLLDLAALAAGPAGEEETVGRLGL